MLKLVSKEGHWATLDNSMIFGNVVWLMDKNDAKKYHLIDDNRNEIAFNAIDYMIDD